MCHHMEGVKISSVLNSDLYRVKDVSFRVETSRYKMKNLHRLKITTGYTLCVLTLLVFFISVSKIHATTFYSRNSANWNVNSTWSTVGFGGVAATSYPQVNDTAKIGNTYTVTVNTNVTCTMIEIGQGTSGILQFSGAGTYTLVVSGDVIVNSGGTLIYNSNNSRTHIMQIGGNLTNNGTVDLYTDLNDIVNLTFNTGSSTIVSGSGTWALNNVTINKSSSTPTVEVQVNAFETAINTFAGTSGNYIHNNSGTFSVNASVSVDFAINANMVYTIPQGTMWFSPNSNRTYLYGSLIVSGGNVYIGSTAGNNGLRYDKIGTNIPYLEISSGVLNAYGGISYATGAGSDPFSFRMTGGAILLNNGTSGTNVECFLVNDVATSVFYMSAGTITIQDHNTSGGNNLVDWGVCGTNGTVTSLGGTIEFGNSATPNGAVMDFTPFPNVVQPNFKITGSADVSVTLMTAKSTESDFKLLSLYIDTNKTFDIRAINGIPGDYKNMTLTSTYDGVNAFVNKGTFNAQLGTVTMGGTAAQSIGGSSTTSFYNLVINNPAGVTLDHNENVSTLLTLTSGLLNTTSTKLITCLSLANATMGSATSYVNGPMKQTVATNSPTTRNFPIGRSGVYRPAILSATHNNTVSVIYTGEMVNTSAASLGYGLPSTVNKVSNTRYWNFERENIPNLTGANVTLYYDLDDTVPDRNRIIVVHDDGSARWVDQGGNGTSDDIGNITSTVVTSFNTKFAIGYPPSPLPVTIVSFKAKVSGNKVSCEWETASEINNDYFTVERSADGIQFASIGSVKGAGNSTTPKYYQFTDEFPLSGNSYYRLRQKDFDGTYTYSEAEHIIIETKINYVFFPNPSPGKIHIQRPGQTMEGNAVVIRDMNGKEITSEQNLSSNKDELIIDIDPASSSGLEFFVLNVVSEHGMVQEKIFVEKK